MSLFTYVSKVSDLLKQSAPLLEPIPTTKVDRNSAFLVSKICTFFHNMMDYVSAPLEQIPAWNRLRLFFSTESVTPIPA